jgi:hypothetical protein
MLGHLQKLLKQGFMMVVELTTYHVPEGLAFPAPAEGYVVSFMAFNERGFSTPLHQLFRLLPWHDGLELTTKPPRGPSYSGLHDTV